MKLYGMNLVKIVDRGSWTVDCYNFQEHELVHALRPPRDTIVIRVDRDFTF